MNYDQLLRFRGSPLLAGLLMSACVGSTQHSQAAARARSPADQVRADAGVQAFTSADVSFMQGMIRHHAQAVVMAGWAPTHAASEAVKILAGRIDVGQRDEIAFMERWLRDRRQTTPDPLAANNSAVHQMSMPGMSMPGMTMSDSLMPGMLTPPQMEQLSAATGPEFDRLFLTFMIQHHQGALTMVNRLFSTQGAAQEEYVFRFASDVSTDQTTEINRMRSMLTAQSPPRDRP
jgi:uncharacterized protein (DUF305 family)